MVYWWQEVGWKAPNNIASHIVFSKDDGLVLKGYTSGSKRSFWSWFYAAAIPAIYLPKPKYQKMVKMDYITSILDGAWLEKPEELFEDDHHTYIANHVSAFAYRPLSKPMLERFLSNLLFTPKCSSFLILSAFGGTVLVDIDPSVFSRMVSVRTSVRPYVRPSQKNAL